MQSNTIKIGNTYYISLISHDINVKNGDRIYHFGKSKTVPRIKNHNVPIKADFMTYIQIDEEIVELPAQKPNTVYIVSLFVAQAAMKLYPDRYDIVSLGKKVRGANGRIEYTLGLKLSNTKGIPNRPAKEADTKNHPKTPNPVNPNHKQNNQIHNTQYSNSFTQCLKNTFDSLINKFLHIFAMR